MPTLEKAQLSGREGGAAAGDLGKPPSPRSLTWGPHGKKQARPSCTRLEPCRDAVPDLAVTLSLPHVGVRVHWGRSAVVTQVAPHAGHCRTGWKRSWRLAQSFPFTSAAEEAGSVGTLTAERGQETPHEVHTGWRDGQKTRAEGGCFLGMLMVSVTRGGGTEVTGSLRRGMKRAKFLRI